MSEFVVVLAFASGLLFGLGAMWAYRELLREATQRADQATERLVQAWRDGYTVPVIAATEPKPVESGKPLPAGVVEWLDQWDEAGRARWEAIARQYQSTGFTGDGILRKMERHGGES